MTLFRQAPILWERLRAGFWPLPAAMMLFGAVLFRIAFWLDQHGLPPAWMDSWLVQNGSVDNARSLMSTLVSAMITMASLVFSITVVALTLAASQFGSRLVRSYVRDLQTRLMLGLFVLTILYCLLALRVTGGGIHGGVPHLTVSLGLFLGVLCVFAMLMFIHRVSQAIVADEVIRRVARELEQSIESLPDPGAAGEREPTGAGGFGETPLPVLAEREGYVEAVRYQDLLACAQAHNAYVLLHVMAGQFVARGDRIIGYARAGGRSAEFERLLRTAVIVGPERTPVQDLEFSMRHLVDVALRALSPGINDENTALVVVDRLRGAMARLLRKRLPSGRLADEGGQLRVVGRRYTHQEHIENALAAILDAAAGHPRVAVTLIEALERLMPHAPDAALRAFLLEQAERAAQVGLADGVQPWARLAIERALARARERSGA